LYASQKLVGTAAGGTQAARGIGLTRPKFQTRHRVEQVWPPGNRKSGRHQRSADPARRPV